MIHNIFLIISFTKGILNKIYLKLRWERSPHLLRRMKEKIL